MGVAVDHKADVVVAVDGLGQPRRAEEGVDLRRLAHHRIDHRRIVQQHDRALGAQHADGVLDAVGVLDRLLHERLDRGLAERAQHVAAEAADESLAAREADALDLIGLAGQHPHPGVAQHLRHMFGLAAFVFVIAQHPDHGNLARPDVLQQDLDLARLAEIGQVAAQAQDVGVLMHLFEQGAVGRSWVSPTCRSPTAATRSFFFGPALHPGLGRLGPALMRAPPALQ
jgi:hypothetical protein